MLYELNSYKQNGETWSSYLCWETSKLHNGLPVVCDKLVSYIKPGAKTYSVPEGITTLSALCFVDEELDIFDCDAAVLELPASLTCIEDGAFLFTSFRTVRIAPENTAFVVKKGGLYTADGKRLIWILPAKNDNAVFQVAEGTEQIDDGALFWNGVISIPRSVKHIVSRPKYQVSSHLYLHMRTELTSFRKLLVRKGSYAERFARRVEYNYEVIDLHH